MNDGMLGVRQLIAEATESAGVPLSTFQIQQLVAFWTVLARWNSKVNLTSLPLHRPTPETVKRLIWEPLFASRLPFGEPASWFDLGSGCGSPAIPMKIARSGIHLSMVESLSKKVAFLREAIRETGLQAVEVINSRIEELPGSVPSGSVGLVTMRAVKLTPGIVSSIGELVGQRGKLILFGCPDRGSLRDSFSEETFDSDISLLVQRNRSKA